MAGVGDLWKYFRGGWTPEAGNESYQTSPNDEVVKRGDAPVVIKKRESDIELIKRAYFELTPKREVVIDKAESAKELAIGGRAYDILTCKTASLALDHILCSAYERKRSSPGSSQTLNSNDLTEEEKRAVVAINRIFLINSGRLEPSSHPLFIETTYNPLSEIILHKRSPYDRYAALDFSDHTKENRRTRYLFSQGDEFTFDYDIAVARLKKLSEAFATGDQNYLLSLAYLHREFSGKTFYKKCTAGGAIRPSAGITTFGPGESTYITLLYYGQEDGVTIHYEVGATINGIIARLGQAKPLVAEVFRAENERLFTLTVSPNKTDIF